MDWIAQKIPAVQVVDINVVGIEPSHRPRIYCFEPITAVLKTARPVGELATVHVKRVAATKIGTEARFRNATAASPGLSSIGLLSALPLLCRFGLSLLRGVLRLLRGLGLSLLCGVLRLLRGLGLSLLCGVLRLLRGFGLSLLRGMLRLLRGLGLSLLRGVLRLLRRLGLSLLRGVLRLLRRLGLLRGVLRLLCRPGLLLLGLLFLLVLS